MKRYGVCLHEFVSFLRHRGAEHITSALAVEYAAADDHPWLRRVSQRRDPATEVPHLRLLPFRSKRARPYLYSETEIKRLLKAALTMVSPHPLRQRTYCCLFGLLAVTGMRLGEALSLQPQDVDLAQGLLTIRKAKFDKSRLVPLHPSTCSVLRAYARLRDETYAMREDQLQFLERLGRPPVRLTVEQTAWVLNCQAHDIPILVGARLLRPLGNPPANGIKYFSTEEVLELAQDRSWLAKITNTVCLYWQKKNARKRANGAVEVLSCVEPPTSAENAARWTARVR